MLVVFSLSTFAQNNPYTQDDLIVLSGKVNFGHEKYTKIVILCDLDTIKIKSAKKLYKIRLPQNNEYTVIFFNGKQSKTLHINTESKVYAHIKVDVCWNLPEGIEGVISYNPKTDDYEFSTMSAGKK